MVDKVFHQSSEKQDDEAVKRQLRAFWLFLQMAFWCIMFFSSIYFMIGGIIQEQTLYIMNIMAATVGVKTDDMVRSDLWLIIKIVSGGGSLSMTIYTTVNWINAYLFEE